MLPLQPTKNTTTPTPATLLIHHYRSVAVTLSTPAKAGKFACADLFDVNTTTALGGSALCSVSPDSQQTLTVRLPASAKVQAGDWIVSKAAQAVLVDDLSGSPFTVNMTVSGCSPCDPTVAMLVAPPVSVLWFFGVAATCAKASWFGEVLHNLGFSGPRPICRSAAGYGALAWRSWCNHAAAVPELLFS